jgi:hypothetical protein
LRQLKNILSALPIAAGLGGKYFSIGIACLLILGFVPRAQAQLVGQPVVAAAHAVVNLTDLAREEARRPPQPPEPRVIPFQPSPPARRLPPDFIPPKAPEPPTAGLSLPTPQVPSPPPVGSFEALGDNDTVIPPDTMGAVGANHLMVTLNSQVRVQNRSGGNLSTVSLNSFWSSTGATGVFDPKVVYDPFNNRWIFTAMSNRESASSSVLIGASQSSDPTGSWNLFRFDADSGDTEWADYPSLGFNKDWVLVSVNMFANVGGSFGGARLFLFRKSLLYNGTLTTASTFNPVNGSTLAPAVTYDNSLATLYLADGGWADNNSQLLRISTITGAVGSEVFTECDPPMPCPSGTTFVDSGSDWDFQPPGGNDFAPQSGTTQKIQNGDARLLNVVYRNSSLWAAQNVFLPANAPTRTAAQWWQFTPAGTLQQLGRVDDATGTVFFAYPSIAVNSRNDAVIGFSSFSGSQFASAGYAFRASTDAANTMRDPVLLKAGEATYFKTFSGTRNRWGDYSATVVDPVNDLEFWTIQEYASSPDFPNGDDRWGTWWGKVSPPRDKGRGQLTSQ